MSFLISWKSSCIWFLFAYASILLHVSVSNDLIFVSTDSSFYLSFKLVVLRGAVESFDFQFTALFDKVNGCPGKPEIYLLISWPFFYNLVLDSLVSSIVISKYSECKNYFNFIFLSPVNFLYDLRYFF